MICWWFAIKWLLLNVSLMKTIMIKIAFYTWFVYLNKPYFCYFVFYFIMIFQWKMTILYHSISVEPQTFGIIYSLMLPLFKIRSIHNKQSKIVRYIALDVIVIMNPSMILNHLRGFKFSTFWQIFSSFVALHEI